MRRHLFYKGCLLIGLHDHELPLALLADLEERVHRHFLHAREGFVHELEELEDNGPQKFPMRPQKTWVLSDDVHDVACDDSLVFLAALHFAKAQQVLDDRHQEPLLVALKHSAADGADRPTQAIQQRWRPMLRRALRQTLLRQALQHHAFHVFRVQMREVDQSLPHHLVQSNLVGVFFLSSDDVALLVLLDRHLGRLGHLRDQDQTDVRQHWLVPLQLRSTLGGSRSGATGHAVEEQRGRRRVALRLPPTLLHFEENPCAECLPELHAYLESLLVRAHGNAR
mmetsp:Transcript_106817/g.300286  ORF Transcript_106817/g.300286 Transcript_106817/m.300286 type:complete len:282 (-) Transcript_106817:1213-2058(-)